MRTRIYIFFLLYTAIFLVFYINGCVRNNAGAIPGLKNTVLKPYQDQLLSIAFETATKIPTNPHIKSRCLAQQTVVENCFELDQPQKALEYIEQIENWRKQFCYGELALYCAKHGATKSDIQYFLNLANQVPEQSQEWRKDLVDEKIAQTKAYMERTRQKTDAFDPNSFDKEMENIQKLVSTENFDSVQISLGAYTELYNRYYSNVEYRDQIENKIKSSWDKMPILIRINFLMDMAGFALDHKDKAKALELVNDAQKMKDTSTWPIRYEIPLIAKLAEFHFLAGDIDGANKELKKSLDMFDKNQEKIVNIDKAGILRSIAEACQKTVDTTSSRNIYERAIDAGIENPNSLPRAEDLSATCCSMALHKIEPGEELLNKIKKIESALSDPW